MSVGRKSIYTDEQLAEAIATSFYWSEVQSKLGLKRNTNHSEIKKRAKDLALSTQHFFPHWKKGLEIAKTFEQKLIPLSDVLIENSTYSPSSLRKRLVDEGVLEYSCSRCGLIEWQGIKLILELHHKNGKKKDNRIENIEFLCPNCHSITNTWKGKNRQ